MSKNYKLQLPIEERSPVCITPECVVTNYSAGYSIEALTKIAWYSGVFTRKQHARDYVKRCIYDETMKRQRYQRERCVR